MALSNDEILQAVGEHLKENQMFAQQLGKAVEAGNESWIRQLIRGVFRIVEIAADIIDAITNWFS